MEIGFYIAGFLSMHPNKCLNIICSRFILLGWLIFFQVSTALSQSTELSSLKNFCPWSNSSSLLYEGSLEIEKYQIDTKEAVQTVHSVHVQDPDSEIRDLFEKISTLEPVKKLLKTSDISINLISSQTEPVSASTDFNEIKIKISVELLEFLRSKLSRESYRKAISAYLGHELGHFLVPEIQDDILSPASIQSKLKRHMLIDSVAMLLANIKPYEFAQYLTEIDIFLKNFDPNTHSTQEILIRSDCFLKLKE